MSKRKRIKDVIQKQSTPPISSKLKSTVIWRIKEKYSPYAGEFRGCYLQIAVRNIAGNAFGKQIMSFDKPWKVEPDRLIETQIDLHRALAILQKRYKLVEYERNG